jgi:hypothetical protein
MISQAVAPALLFESVISKGERMAKGNDERINPAQQNEVTGSDEETLRGMDDVGVDDDDDEDFDADDLDDEEEDEEGGGSF